MSSYQTNDTNVYLEIVYKNEYSRIYLAYLVDKAVSGVCPFIKKGSMCREFRTYSAARLFDVAIEFGVDPHPYVNINKRSDQPDSADIAEEDL